MNPDPGALEVGCPAPWWEPICGRDPSELLANYLPKVVDKALCASLSLLVWDIGYGN